MVDDSNRSLNTDKDCDYKRQRGRKKSVDVGIYFSSFITIILTKIEGTVKLIKSSKKSLSSQRVQEKDEDKYQKQTKTNINSRQRQI